MVGEVTGTRCPRDWSAKGEEVVTLELVRKMTLTFLYIPRLVKIVTILLG
jgi:hypothetical protein